MGAVGRVAEASNNKTGGELARATGRSWGGEARQWQVEHARVQCRPWPGSAAMMADSYTVEAVQTQVT